MKRIFAAILAGMILLTMAGCSNSGVDTPREEGEKNSVISGEDGPTYELRLGHCLAADSPYELGASEFARLVSEYTDGKVSITSYPASQLGDERALWEGVTMGTIDIALSSTATLCNFDDRFLCLELPFLFPDYDTAQKVLYSDFGQNKLADLRDIGIVGLDYWWAGWNNFASCNEPFIKPEDVVGKNIRCMESTMWVSYVKSLGANPTPMAMSETYTALQNKTLDGCSYPLVTIWTSAMYEVTNSYSRGMNACYASVPIAINAKLFDGMPVEYQEAIKKAALEAGEYERSKVLEMIDEAQETLTNDYDYEINDDIDQSLWRTAVQGCYDEMIPTYVPQEDYDAIMAIIKS